MKCYNCGKEIENPHWKYVRKSGTHFEGDVPASSLVVEKPFCKDCY